MKPLLLVLGLLLTAGPAHAEPRIAWQDWSPQVFEQARAGHKQVFLYLEATWCHWCHVMQQTTLQDPQVLRELSEHYLAVRVDHDANPLLANRYRDYGWPALIFFGSDGQELVKRAGHIEPADFARLLQAIEQDPTPERAAPPVRAASSAVLSAAQRQDLLQRHESSYDSRIGGLRTGQKYLERDSVEYALRKAQLPAERRKAEQTLDAARALLDPVWGGFYQYSTGGDWQHPHYEKIMRTQAGVLRLYAQAYGTLGRATDLRVADRIRDYLFAFLRAPNGAFHTSQDADLKPGQKATAYYALNDRGRRAQGLPRVAPGLYTDASAQAAEALAVHATYADVPSSLDAAEKALRWADAERRGLLGGLRHGEARDTHEYLADNLAAARAALALYRASGERAWLQRAISGGNHIGQHFVLPAGGLASASLNTRPLPPQPVLEENLSAARFFNLLHQHSGDVRHRRVAESALRQAIGADQAHPAIEEAGLLLADEEFAHAPIHLTVVGSARDPQALALFRSATAAAPWYARVEWQDPLDEPLPNTTVSYPRFARAAGYSCSEGRCSAPRFTPEDYRKAIAQLPR